LVAFSASFRLLPHQLSLEAFEASFAGLASRGLTPAHPMHEYVLRRQCVKSLC